MTTGRIVERFARPLRVGQRLLRSIQPPAPGSFRILLFHDLAGVQIGAFRRLVESLAAEKRLLAPGVAAAPRPGTASQAPSGFILSFDDGFASNLSAGRMLQEDYGTSAVFFVCPGLMELSGESQKAAVARHIFDGRVEGHTLRADQRLLTWDEVGKLIEMGHVLGSHTLSHRRLAGLPPGALAEEVAGAAELIRQRLGQSSDWFAYPFGDAASVDGPALKIIKNTHQYCRSGVRGENGPGGDAFLLFAEQIDLDASFTYQRFVADGGLDLRYRQARRKLMEDLRRTNS